MAKNTENKKLYRVVKFEIHPTTAEIQVLRKISHNLFLVWNQALEERLGVFNEHIAPLYQKLKDASLGAKEANLLTQLRADLSAAYKEHTVTLFDQINALTRKREDAGFARIPRNWQEETLDTLDGAFKSFVTLRKNGDRDARPPRSRSEWNFNEIPGRFGFKLLEENSAVTIMCKNVAEGLTLKFAIPEYQKEYLDRMDNVKKFTLYRDQPDMRRPGRFWISLASEVEMPAERPLVPEELVFVALGASSIGVISAFGEEVISMARPDKHWKPATDSVEERMSTTKGSRAWKRRNAARQKMFRLMGSQQKLERRTVVQELLSHGVHFVVTDLVVRSKKGKLADSTNLERGGQLGLNWSAQNTGSLAYLVQWLEEKVRERGGSARKYRLSGKDLPLGKGRENKIPIARALRDDFLSSLEASV